MSDARELEDGAALLVLKTDTDDPALEEAVAVTVAVAVVMGLMVKAVAVRTLRVKMARLRAIEAM